MDFPKEKARFPPACIWRISTNQIAKMTTQGSMLTSRATTPLLASRAVMVTPASSSRLSSASLSLTGSSTVNDLIAPVPWATAMRKSPFTSLPS